MIESEFKYSLNGEAYNKLLLLGDGNFHKNTFIQINYYYDSDQFELDRAGITLRIRQIETDLKLQIKSPIVNDGALRVNKEISKNIARLPLTMNFSNDEWHELIRCQSDLQLKGILVTQRTKLGVADGIEVVLDKSYYLGLIDYELEVEFQEGLHVRALHFINNNIDADELIPSRHGKRSRFFNALMRG